MNCLSCNNKLKYEIVLKLDKTPLYTNGKFTCRVACNSCGHIGIMYLKDLIKE